MPPILYIQLVLIHNLNSLRSFNFTQPHGSTTPITILHSLLRLTRVNPNAALEERGYGGIPPLLYLQAYGNNIPYTNQNLSENFLFPIF